MASRKEEFVRSCRRGSDGYRCAPPWPSTTTSWRAYPCSRRRGADRARGRGQLLRRVRAGERRGRGGLGFKRAAMRVTPYGAVRTVTGSMHLVETGGLRLLLDCGLFQGRRAESQEINASLPFPASSIDAVVLSHAHLDHCGNLPTLVSQGFNGPIYCTPATRDLAALVLRDSAKVQRQDIRYVNKIRRRQGQRPVAPLYTGKEAGRANRRLGTVPFRRDFSIGTARVRFYDAGHILGSAITALEADGRVLGFSGDLGRLGAPIVRDPEGAPAVGLLLMETTYGDRLPQAYAQGGG